MSLIQIDHLTFSYPTSADPIFEDVSLRLDTDWKLGFVGRNGRGKTTLLRLLMGEYEYSGRIQRAVKFDYFPYPVAEPQRLTGEILEEICPQALEWEIARELSCLDMDPDVVWRPFDTLSGGEQTKALLAALFLKEEHFLLIDEPTNHLDEAARERVAAYLKRKKGFILVSHDRRFLDGCIDHVLSLNRTNIEVRQGTFSSWMEQFTRQQERETAQNERLRKDISRLKTAAERTAQWSDRVEQSKKGAKNAEAKPDRGYIGHKAAKLMKRSKGIEARRQQAAEEKAGLLKNVEKAEALKMTPLRYHVEVLAAFSELSIRYGETVVCAPLTDAVRQGERVALSGGNGSGKSSLLKLLLGENIGHSGILTVGSGLRISYVPQDTSHLRGNLSDFAERYSLDESLFKAVLRKLNVERTQFEKDMSEFSGGQKKKVLLAKSLCEPAHLYVWDEPLNFIDIYSRMQIEQLILEWKPTMLFVEHDGAFREAVATRVIEL